MNPIATLQNLLESADPTESAKHSFANYHARGFTYVNLLRTERLTAKLYIANPGDVLLDGHGYLVNPHSHGYDFSTMVVEGWMENITFARSVGDRLRIAETWHAHRYSSPMKGTAGCAPAGKVELHEEWIRRLYTGESYELDVEQVHTIRIPQDRRTVLFLLQYADVRADTLLFTREPDPPPLDGLYQRMSAERIAGEIERVRSVVVRPRRSGWVSTALEGRAA